MVTSMPPPEENLNESAVLEYAPSGKFIQAFAGSQTPGLGESHRNGGFGGPLRGVAVDPRSGDVLVSVEEINTNVSAIDEFDSSGHFLGQITATIPGHGLRSASSVVVDSEGDLYVVDGGEAINSRDIEHAVDVYAEGHFVPGVRLGEATGRTATAAVLNGSVDPEALLNGAGISECRFEYVTEAAFKQNVEAHDGDESEGFAELGSGGSVSCSPEASGIPANEEYDPVHADLAEHISPGVTYRYRLLAATGGTHGGVKETAALAFTAPHAPEIVSTSAGNVSSTFADLEAKIDPLGADTTYHFEYLPVGEFEANGDSFSGPNVPVSVPIPDGSIGAGEPTGSSREGVVRPIGGLTPGGAYEFRVVASNECEAAEHPGKRCVTAGGAQVFATLPAVEPGLPDGRAYELVTPPNKGEGGDMFGVPILENGEVDSFNIEDVGAPSESGDQFLLQTYSAFGPFPFASTNGYVFSRHPAPSDPGREEWSYTSLASPALGVQTLAGNSLVFDPADFSQVGFVDNVGSAASVEGSRPTSLLGSPSGPYATLHADSPYAGGQQEFEEQTRIVGGSRDLSHVVLESGSHALAGGDEGQVAGSHALYEYSGGGLRLLNVSSKGTLLSECGAVLGAGYGADGGGAHDAVSADGSRVFFTAPDPSSVKDLGPHGEGCWNGKTTNAPQLYTRSGSSTVEVSKPERGVTDPTGRHPAFYVGASEDGEEVFFLSEAWLTADHPAAHDTELYEYDTETSKLTRVSAGVAGQPGATAGAGVFTIPAISADGSAVYFTAFGALAKGAEAHTEAQRLVNLYSYDTTSATIDYVATINTYDYPNNIPGGCGEYYRASGRASAESFALCPEANWYTTPEGRYLLFATSRELTGYSTAGPCQSLPDSGGVINGHCDEVYRYDSTDGDLICVSCNPNGVAPVSNAGFSRSVLDAPAAGTVRAMSDDGSYVFFDTADALVSTDSNHMLDVYEWEAQGTGGCVPARGCVHLISSGKDPGPSFFLGASADGSNVFFGTHARLVPADSDSDGDVYDARICTSVEPCIKPGAGETAQCEGDACHTPPPAPIDATPSSLTFSGPGNLIGALSPRPRWRRRRPRRRRRGVPVALPRGSRSVRGTSISGPASRSTPGSQTTARGASDHAYLVEVPFVADAGAGSACSGGRGVRCRVGTGQRRRSAVDADIGLASHQLRSQRKTGRRLLPGPAHEHRRWPQRRLPDPCHRRTAVRAHARPRGCLR